VSKPSAYIVFDDGTQLAVSDPYSEIRDAIAAIPIDAVSAWLEVIDAETVKRIMVNLIAVKFVRQGGMGL